MRASSFLKFIGSPLNFSALFWSALVLPALTWSTTLSAAAISLDDYLQQVKEKNRLFQAFEFQKQGSESKRIGQDLGLQPSLTLKGNQLDDRKVQNFGSAFSLIKNTQKEYSLGLGKKFTTGTSAQVTAAVGETTSTYSAGLGSSDLTQGYSSLGISLTQSLWKDFFGSTMRLNRQRNSVTESFEKKNIEWQYRQNLIAAEILFWDSIYVQEEVEQRKKSLDRATKILDWVKRRFGNGIGDKSDLLNAEGLLATRKLQLITSEDEKLALKEKIKDQMRSDLPVVEIEMQAPLEKPRSLFELAQVQEKEKSVIRMDAYLSVLDEKLKNLISEEVADSVRPDLTLGYLYKTNPNEASFGDAAGKLSQNTNPTSNISLQFVWFFSGTVKNSIRRSAEFDALSSKLKRDQTIRESQTSWSELVRRHQEFSKKVEAAFSMSDLQTKKSEFEREKLSKGRSITSQVVTAEQDASEAQLTLTKLYAEHRKLEAQARLYMPWEGL